ncbi:hypothetical protein HPB49_007617 [Dermacentor silvarum]|uniref:Uncharacterized protein n=1 Tax=Dermacentor silvarum TaxID=543639 RepID=A0ACB8DB94_DERSI|nr:hypothetical protein HPB49_007617 [Dermacentor silvarum]
MIVPFIILRNVLEFVRPIAAKLQKRDGDIVEAYNMIDKTIDRMKHVREQIESEYDDWFQTAEELALSVDTVITKPRLLGFQRNRANAPAADAREYYRLNVAVPFLDHVIQQMDSRFPKSDRVGLALLQLLPPAVTSVDLEKLRNDLLFWEIDLPAPCSLKMELREWRNFWSREGGAMAAENQRLNNSGSESSPQPPPHQSQASGSSSMSASSNIHSQPRSIASKTVDEAASAAPSATEACGDDACQVQYCDPWDTGPAAVALRQLRAEEQRNKSPTPAHTTSAAGRAASTAAIARQRRIYETALDFHVQERIPHHGLGQMAQSPVLLLPGP